MKTVDRRLLAASGYLELGMLADAAAELAGLPEEDQHCPAVVAFRMDLHMAAKEWSAGAELAAQMVAREPEQPGWWINYAYCTRRAESVEKAEAILLDAVERHPREAMIIYNLACYAGVTGRLAEARERLDRAIALDGHMELLARDDEDLALLRKAL